MPSAICSLLYRAVLIKGNGTEVFQFHNFIANDASLLFR